MTSHACAVASQPAPSAEKRGRVVLVDDEPGILETWCVILTRSGYEVECCSDPVSALETIAAGCDCVITDYHMPLMSGVELMRKARAWSKAKFILMTANGSEAVTQDALAAGAACIVHKPTSTPLVLQKLASLCGRAHL
jgi:putative two-component system response regulator